LDVLIRAVPSVSKALDAHFVIVGDGDRTAKLKSLAQSLRVERKVSFLGWIDHESPDLPQIYQIAAVFAQPSSIEAQSIVALEAMAAGLPVVAADGGALPELVEDGENGFLFPPGSADDMAERIVRILRQDGLRTRMRKRSLELVSIHQIENSFDRVKCIYEEVRKRCAA